MWLLVNLWVHQQLELTVRMVWVDSQAHVVKNGVGFDAPQLFQVDLGVRVLDVLDRRHPSRKLLNLYHIWLLELLRQKPVIRINPISFRNHIRLYRRHSGFPFVVLKQRLPASSSVLLRDKKGRLTAVLLCFDPHFGVLKELVYLELWLWIELRKLVRQLWLLSLDHAFLSIGILRLLQIWGIVFLVYQKLIAEWGHVALERSILFQL